MPASVPHCHLSKCESSAVWDDPDALVSCASGVVFMAGHVYAVGGFNGSLRVRTVDVYDGVKDQWTSIASMQERRSTLGAAVLNDLLYAVGGFDGSTGRSRTYSPSSLRHALHVTLVWSFPSGTAVKNPPANAGDIRDAGSVPELGKIPPV